MNPDGTSERGRPSEGGPHDSQRARRRRVAARRIAREARVLVAECDANAMGIAELVRALGYEVASCGTIADAVREAAREARDVVVASIPYIDVPVLKLLQLLRRARPQVPLVLVTASDSLVMRRRCQELRAYYVVVRPVDPDELRDVLADATAHARALARA
jgi:DNA-binding NtrC family response regulator